MPPPVAIVGVFEAVEAYPACGNEPFEHDGVTWYPVSHVGYDPIDDRLGERLDQIVGVDREQPADDRVDGLVRVAEPGPGDDIGTLVVWADGAGRWTSDSGDLDVWVSDDEVTYHWVC